MNKMVRHLSSLLLAMLLSAAGTAFGDANTAEDAHWKVINYWSITCAPCRIEIPELNELSVELATVDVQVLGINFDDHERDKTLQLAERMGIEFPTLTRSAVAALAITPPNVLPTTVILDPNDEVQATLVGVQDRQSIKQKLRDLMGDAS